MKKILISILILIGVMAAATGVALFTRVKIPAAPEEQIRIYTRNKPKVKMTVAVIKDGDAEITAYGHDAKQIDVPDMSYDIMPISDTFAGECAAKAVLDGKMDLNSKISDYIAFEVGTYSPSIYELLTHTSAYGSYASNATTREEVVAAIDNFRLHQQPTHLYAYSHFGIKVLELVLESMYETEYDTLIQEFADSELEFKNTDVTLTEAYSNISDMIDYAGQIMSPPTNYITLSTRPLIEVNMETKVAYLWNIDENGVINCGGDSENGSCAMLVDRESGISVIVLSNYGTDKYGGVEKIAYALLDKTKGTE